MQTFFCAQDIPLHAQFVVVLCIPAKHNYVKRVAGESLIISLEGIDLADAGLSFSGEAANVTLVTIWDRKWME